MPPSTNLVDSVLFITLRVISLPRTETLTAYVAMTTCLMSTILTLLRLGVQSFL